MRKYFIVILGIVLSCKSIAQCDVPKEFKTISVTSNSLTLIWEGSAPAYAVIVKTDDVKPNASENGVQINGHSGEWKNLSPNTKYYGFIRSICSASEKSDWSDAVFFETTGTNANSDLSKLPPSIQIGVGIGPNFSGQNWEYYISPLDNTLKRDYLSDVSLVGSVILSYTPKFKYAKTETVLNPAFNKNKGKGDSGKEPEFVKQEIPNKDFKAPGWFTILGSFNLGQVNTSIGFNTRLSGGIGVGVNIQNTMQIGLFCDFTQVRALRSNYKDSLNKELRINNIPITSLDVNDNRFFKNSSQPSFSIKFIYLLSRRKGDMETGLSPEEGIQLKKSR